MTLCIECTAGQYIGEHGEEKGRDGERVGVEFHGSVIDLIGSCSQE